MTFPAQLSAALTPFGKSAAHHLIPLPAGKLTVRHRQMRNVWQVFAGRTYVSGASGDSPDEAIESLRYQYRIDGDTQATVYGVMPYWATVLSNACSET